MNVEVATEANVDPLTQAVAQLKALSEIFTDGDEHLFDEMERSVRKILALARVNIRAEFKKADDHDKEALFMGVVDLLLEEARS